VVCPSRPQDGIFCCCCAAGRDLHDRGVGVRTEKMRLIGRMHGRGWYARTSDLFLMDRLELDSWEANKR